MDIWGVELVTKKHTKLHKSTIYMLYSQRNNQSTCSILLKYFSNSCIIFSNKRIFKSLICNACLKSL